ncbi:MAG: helix-turn-helix transcriptional regulator [Bacteroidetes bacterium]|nr:helix-turn-helix transcriptional regulator [Bacteroidota bacterium]
MKDSNGIFLKQMGAKIRAARNAKKISLRKLGKLCQLQETNIMRIEHGKKSCRILTLKNIADKLEVDVKDFL